MMTAVSERHMIDSEPRGTSDISSVLGTLIERIETSHEINDAYAMTAAEVDEMLGMHRSLDAIEAENEARPSIDVKPSHENHLTASEGIAEQRSGQVFERGRRITGLLRAVLIPTLAVGVLTGVAAWWITGSADSTPIGAPTSTDTTHAIVSEAQQPSLGTPSSTASPAHAADDAANISAQHTLPGRNDADIARAVEAAMADAGVAHARVSVVDGAVTVVAVAPVDLLSGGYFARRAQLERLAEVDGATGVDIRLELRGDAAMLSDALLGLMSQHPILFASGSAEVRIEDLPVLDQVAAVVATQPGLPVIIAGTTDTSGSVATNERLARERATAVSEELIARGVPQNRLQVVSYGELFGENTDQARTIRFEVGS
jgi:flagellar motor protein MotB